MPSLPEKPPENGEVTPIEASTTEEKLHAVRDGVERDTPPIDLLFRQEIGLSPDAYDQIRERLRDDGVVEQLFSTFLERQTAKIRETLTAEKVATEKRHQEFKTEASLVKQRYEEDSKRKHLPPLSESGIWQLLQERIAHTGERLVALQAVETAGPREQIGALLDVPRLETHHIRTLLLTASFLAEKEHSNAPLQSVQGATARVLLERGIDSDGQLLPDKSAFSTYFEDQGEQKDPLSTIFGPRFRHVSLTSKRVEGLYTAHDVPVSRSSFYKQVLTPEARDASKNTQDDSEPYSKQWRTVWDERDTNPQKQALANALHGKVVIDLFGGQWDSDGSSIQKIATDAGALWYVNEDYFAIRRPTTIIGPADDPRFDPKEMKQYAQDLKDINATIGITQPKNTQVDYNNKDGLYALTQLPSNAENVAIVINGVNYTNIHHEEYHQYLAWEIARVLPEGGTVICYGADAAKYFADLGLVLSPAFSVGKDGEYPQIWTKPKGHVLDATKLDLNFSFSHEIFSHIEELIEGKRDNVLTKLRGKDINALRSFEKDLDRFDERLRNAKDLAESSNTAFNNGFLALQSLTYDVLREKKLGGSSRGYVA